MIVISFLVLVMVIFLLDNLSLVPWLASVAVLGFVTLACFGWMAWHAYKSPTINGAEER